MTFTRLGTFWCRSGLGATSRRCLRRRRWLWGEQGGGVHPRPDEAAGRLLQEGGDDVVLVALGRVPDLRAVDDGGHREGAVAGAEDQQRGDHREVPEHLPGAVGERNQHGDHPEDPGLQLVPEQGGAHDGELQADRQEHLQGQTELQRAAGHPARDLPARLREDVPALLHRRPGQAHPQQHRHRRGTPAVLPQLQRHPPRQRLRRPLRPDQSRVQGTQGLPGDAHPEGQVRGAEDRRRAEAEGAPARPAAGPRRQNHPQVALPEGLQGGNHPEAVPADRAAEQGNRQHAVHLRHPHRPPRLYRNRPVQSREVANLLQNHPPHPQVRKGNAEAHPAVLGEDPAELLPCLSYKPILSFVNYIMHLKFNSKRLIPFVYISGLCFQNDLYSKYLFDYSRYGRTLNDSINSQLAQSTSRPSQLSNNQILDQSESLLSKMNFSSLFKVAQFHQICYNAFYQFNKYIVPILIPISFLYPLPCGRIIGFLFYAQNIQLIYNLLKVQVLKQNQVWPQQNNYDLALLTISILVLSVGVSFAVLRVTGMNRITQLKEQARQSKEVVQKGADEMKNV